MLREPIEQGGIRLRTGARIVAIECRGGRDMGGAAVRLAGAHTHDRGTGRGECDEIRISRRRTSAGGGGDEVHAADGALSRLIRGDPRMHRALVELDLAVVVLRLGAAGDKKRR
jgi:hypothetical protein